LRHGRGAMDAPVNQSLSIAFTFRLDQSLKTFVYLGGETKAHAVTENLPTV